MAKYVSNSAPSALERFGMLLISYFPVFQGLEVNIIDERWRVDLKNVKALSSPALFSRSSDSPESIPAPKYFLAYLSESSSWSSMNLSAFLKKLWDMPLSFEFDNESERVLGRWTKVILNSIWLLFFVYTSNTTLWKIWIFNYNKWGHCKKIHRL